MCWRLALVCGVLLGATVAFASVRLAEVFTDGLCLQRDALAPVWGTAAVGEVVTVSLQGQQVTVTAGADGHWLVRLAPLRAGGPFTLQVVGQNTITFPTVYVGDVWLCYGQSNMQWEINRATSAAEAAKETTPEIRLLHVHRPWAEAGGDALQQFSAVGYYFGRALHAKLHVPIGLIYGGEGGTPAEVWMPEDRLKALGYTGNRLWNLFYTDRVLMLGTYAIKGCIWYQGENNAGNTPNYAAVMGGLIAGWRAQFQQGDFPFLFVQLARINGPATPPAPTPNSGWATLREAQTETLRVPNTGMVVCYDMTNGNIHPPYKIPVGERLALLARTQVYGERPARQFTCPRFASVTRTGHSALLSFTAADDGWQLRKSVVAADGTVTLESATAIADLFLLTPEGRALTAPATIDGARVKVTLPDNGPLPDLYYAWSDYPQGNLYNKAGLPLSPFRLTSTTVTAVLTDEHTITLSASRPLAPAAAKRKSYAVAGAKITRVVVNSALTGVTLTTDRAWQAGETVTIALPGLKAWDGRTALPAVTAAVH